MRRRARHRLEVQVIARTFLELPSARSRPRITFRRRHTPSHPHGDQPFRHLIKAASPLDALRDSSLDAAARPRRTSPLSALVRCNSHLCRGSCYIDMVRATVMGRITKASRYEAVTRLCQQDQSPRSPSACHDVQNQRNRPGQISTRSGPPFRPAPRLYVMSEYQIHTSLDISCTNTHVAFPKVRKYSVPRCSKGKYPGPKSIPMVGPANQCRGSPQQFRIPAGPRSLAVRARIWVAIEVSGHRCPNDRYGVRSRRHGRV